MVQAGVHNPAASARQRPGASPLKCVKRGQIFMNIFYRPKYQSDTTRFIDELKAKDAQMASRQSQGRALLWNRTLDRDALNGYQAAHVSQQPYVYQTATR
jgi:hypothetical protein